MSGPINAIVPSAFVRAPAATFIAANSTTAKILLEPFLGAAALGTDPAFYGGGTVIDMTATSTDGSSKDVMVYSGRLTTTQSVAATGSMATTTSTITRTIGDFVADQWRVGDLVMTFAPPTLASNAVTDGILGTVTTVAALTLTLSGTPFAALTLVVGTRLFRIRPLFRATVAAGSGTNGTVASAGLLNNGLDGSALRYELKVGATEALIVGMQAAVSALPAYVSVGAVAARY